MAGSFLGKLFGERPKYTSDLGEGYYYTYNEAPNGYGGYHDVNITLRRHDSASFAVRLTNGSGEFVKFPGVVHGSWEKYLNKPLKPVCSFRCGLGGFKDGRAEFYWMVQPDGRYYGDDDGFGMDDDVEVNLHTFIDKNGRFTGPFQKS